MRILELFVGKRIRTGIVRGGGRSPGYGWSVFFLAIARDEAMKVLSEEQYHHLADQFKQLASEADPVRCELIDVRSIENFYELRDKGGPLGKLNIRAFFHMDKRHRAIVVLATIKKENDGPTPLGDKVTARVRQRRYEAGEYGVPGQGEV